MAVGAGARRGPAPRRAEVGRLVGAAARPRRRPGRGRLADALRERGFGRAAGPWPGPPCCSRAGGARPGVGGGGRLQPVAYPADWQRVRDALAADDRPGDVLVLPFGAYRASPGTTTDRSWIPRPAGCPGRPSSTTSWSSTNAPWRGRTAGRLRSGTTSTTRRRSPVTASAGCWSSTGRPGRRCPRRFVRCPRRGRRRLVLYRVPGAVDGPRRPSAG